MLVLGRQTPGSENLDLGKLHVIPVLPWHVLYLIPPPSSPKDQPLATDFYLGDGSVYVICPTVPPGSNYIVVCEYRFLTMYGLLSHPIQCLGIRGMRALSLPSQAQVRAIAQRLSPRPILLRQVLNFHLLGSRCNDFQSSCITFHDLPTFKYHTPLRAESYMDLQNDSMFTCISLYDFLGFREASFDIPIFFLGAPVLD